MSFTWVDGPGGGTPLNAANLNALEARIETGGLVHAPLRAERYGASPDNTSADNATAFAAMIADLPTRGGDMKIGSGEYLTSSISLPVGKRFSLTGEGAGGTCLKLATGAGGYVLSYAGGAIPSDNPGGSGGFSSSANFDYVTIGDLMIDGNKAGQSGGSAGIYLDGLDYFLIDRVFIIEGRSNGILLSRCDEGVISSTLLSNCGWQTGSAAISVANSSHDITLTGIGVENSPGTGVLFSGTYECEISASNMWNNNRHVSIEKPGATTPHDVKITGGLYELSTAEAIRVTGYKHQIHGPKIMGTGTVGIALEGVTDSQVIGAMVDGPTAGIVESGVADRNQIALNRVFSGGITVVGGSSVQTANMT